MGVVSAASIFVLTLINMILGIQVLPVKLKTLKKNIFANSICYGL